MSCAAALLVATPAALLVVEMAIWIAGIVAEGWEAAPV
jgi:hypothetical protein